MSNTYIEYISMLMRHDYSAYIEIEITQVFQIKSIHEISDQLSKQQT